MLMGELVNRAPGRDARDVHHHIHRGMARVDVGSELGHLVVVGDVQHAMRGHLRAERTGVGDGLVEAVGVAVGEKQLGPWAANARAVARPMPLAAPVTKQRLPRKSLPCAMG